MLVKEAKSGSRIAGGKSCVILLAILSLVLVPGTGGMRGAGSSGVGWLDGWAENGTSICAVPADQYQSCMISNDGGGVVIAWVDARDGGVLSVYVQRISANGEAAWDRDGVRTCSAAYDQQVPVIVSDGDNGAIVAWVDYRSEVADIYAQRIGADGDIMWGAEGVRVCSESQEKTNPRIASDGAGGAIIVWEDFRQANWDLYCQRIDASGALQWATAGVALDSATDDQTNSVIVTLESGGVMIAWQDERSGSSADIYAQKLSLAGEVSWTADGLCIADGSGNQTYPRMVEDSGGGAILAWTSDENGSLDVFARRVNADGTFPWGTGSVLVCGASGDQSNQDIARDGTGGAIITWADGRGANSDIYGQRISSAGVTLWDADGAAVCSEANDQLQPRIASTPTGGAVIVWQDHRNATSDVFLQFVDADGEPLRSPNGVPICSAVGDQSEPLIAPNHIGGAVVCWIDERAGNKDIYAMRTGPVEISGFVNVDYFFVPSNLWVSMGLEGVAIEAVEEGTMQVTASTVTGGVAGTPDVWGQFQLLLPDGWSGTLRIANVPYPIWNSHSPEEHTYDHLFVDTGANFTLTHETNSTWIDNGLLVSTVAAESGEPHVISDGSGGSIIAWSDKRNDDGDIFVQRIYKDGDRFWGNEGIAVCTHSGLQGNVRVAPNGYEGAIVCWVDNRNGNWDIYAQGVTGWGKTTWGENGSLVGSTAGNQTVPQISTDAAGTPTIVWMDDRNMGTTGYDIYAVCGSLDDEIPVCTANGMQMMPEICQNAPGNIVSGTTIVWTDLRNGNSDIYAQRIDYWTNNTAWASEIPICNAPYNQLMPKIIEDGADGAFIVWEDCRMLGTTSDIYCQRISKYGTPCSGWPQNGVALCSNAYAQTSPHAARDGEGGFIVVWEDNRFNPGINTDIFAQRVSGSGQVLWQTDGIPVCTDASWQSEPRISPDGGGNMLITWTDMRNGNKDIFAQRIDKEGTILGAPNGFAIVTEIGNQYKASLMNDACSNTGAYVAWLDERASVPRLYANRIKSAYSISGYVHNESGVGAEGITIHAIEKNDMVSLTPCAEDVTDFWGYYEIALEEGWEGILKPQPTEWFDTFSPAKSSYYSVNEDICDQNFVASHQGFQWFGDWGLCGRTLSTQFWGSPSIASDGQNGVFVVWQDTRKDAGDIGVQRVDASGNALYAEGGGVVCGASGTQREPRVTSSGIGEATVAWLDQRDGILPSVYVNRLFSSGGTLWADGKVICDTPKSKQGIDLAADANDYVFVAWSERRGDYDQVFVQKLDSEGNLQWGDGFYVSPVKSNNDPYNPQFYSQTNPFVVPDEQGGVVVAWLEKLADGSSPRVWVQRMNGQGERCWGGPSLKKGLCIDQTHDALDQRLIAADNGAIVSYRIGGTIKVARITLNGTFSWLGKPVSELTGLTTYVVTDDGASGVAVAYESADAVYVQRVNDNGERQWGDNGIVAGLNQSGARISAVRDDSALLVAWSTASALRAQKVGMDQEIFWKHGGATVCEATPSGAIEMIGDGLGGAFLAWTLTSGNAALKIHRMNDLTIQARVTSNVPSDGYIFTCPAGLVEGDLNPPQDYEVALEMRDDYLTMNEQTAIVDLGEPVPGIAFYDDEIETPFTEVGELLRKVIEHQKIGGCGSCELQVLVNASPIGNAARLSVRSPDINGDGIVDTDDLDSLTAAYPSPPQPYRACVDFDDNGIVDVVDVSIFSTHYGHSSQQGSAATALSGQEHESPVTANFRLSRSNTNNRQRVLDIEVRDAIGVRLLVLAMSYDRDKLDFVNWLQNEKLQGTTILARTRRNGENVLFLVIHNIGQNKDSVLRIGGVTFAAKDGVEDQGGSMSIKPILGEVLTNAGARCRLMSLDIENNLDGEAPPLTNLLGQNYPNPFNPTTTIEYAIAQDEHVNISVYNINGQLVRTLVDEDQKHNRYFVKWDGRNNRGCMVASGVYFYRIKAGEFEKTKKSILLR